MVNEIALIRREIQDPEERSIIERATNALDTSNWQYTQLLGWIRLAANEIRNMNPVERAAWATGIAAGATSGILQGLTPSQIIQEAASTGQTTRSIAQSYGYTPGAENTQTTEQIWEEARSNTENMIGEFRQVLQSKSFCNLPWKAHSRLKNRKQMNLQNRYWKHNEWQVMGV